MGVDLAGFGAIADLASSIVNKIWPDKTQVERDQMAQALVLLQGQITLNQAQLGVNAAEAANPKLFVSGWRPFIGWVCGAACAWNWIGIPCAVFIAGLLHRQIAATPADLSQMLPVLLGMLGMGGLRTYEKLNGVAAK